MNIILNLLKGFLPHIIIGFLTVGGGWYSLNKWHYGPLKERDKQIKTLKADITAKDIVINNLSTEILELIAKNKVTGFEEYFEGGGDVEVNPYDGNIFLKRVQ